MRTVGLIFHKEAETTPAVMAGAASPEAGASAQDAGAQAPAPAQEKEDVC